MDPLGEHVAIVTGAGAGIGADTARLLAEQGARVAVLDLQLDAADHVAGELRRQGHEAMAVQADVADEEDVRAAVDQIVARTGRIDVLVNNAGLALQGRLIDTSVEEWERVLDVNLRGTFLMIKHAAPRMSEAASIVNVASVAALMAVPGAAAYTAAKGGVVSLTRVAAAELAPTVRVNCVCPGTTLTAMPEQMLLERGGGDRNAGIAVTAKKYLLGRLGRPEEIARTVLFLAGPDSSFLTGAVIVADGGVTAQ
jgi:NAD(P)-dependent dehydrogenase (short-subunit alcohol dehydrogenase family)